MKPLPPFRLDAAVLTHVGMRRTRNEDCIAIGRESLNTPMDDPRLVVQRLDAPGICVVADGMGGHPAGDVASRLAADGMLAAARAGIGDKSALVAAIRHINHGLFREMERVPALYGMGTTIAGVIAGPRGLLAFNVGDSRVYRVRAGATEQVSVDHTMEIAGRITSGHKPARVLSQCLGGFLGEEDVSPHVVTLPLEDGVQFLVCSDGLHDMLSDAQIERCLQPDLRAAVRALFEAAMRAGGIDNISIILARLARDTDT